jgi:heme/copper-type cytochrome/quinol oxidase subunit 3
VQDLSGLPTYGFGLKMTVAWGTLAFIAIESMGFVLAAASYFYLAWLSPQWPLGARPPDLVWSGVFTLVLLASAWPNARVNAAAERQDLRSVRWLLVVLSAVGVALLALRAMEFTTLHVRWDTNAYGSMVWILLGLHTTHLATDVVDTLVLTALMFTRHGHSKRFADASDNAFYWWFVIASWLPIYGLLYWLPRM